MLHNTMAFICKDLRHLTNYHTNHGCAIVKNRRLMNFNGYAIVDEGALLAVPCERLALD